MVSIMLKVYGKIFTLLEDREKKIFSILMIMMFLVAVAEVFGIGTILILLRVLADSNSIFNNEYLNWAYNYFSFKNIHDFQIVLSIVVLFIIVSGLGIKALGTYFIIRFSNMRGYDISRRLLNLYMHQPYEWILNKNTSNIAKGVLAEVDKMISSVMIPSLRLLTNLMLACMIVIFLLWVNPLIALIAAVLVGGGYAVIYIMLRGRLLELGHVMVDANKSRYHLTQEMTSGFKEVKLMGLEDLYIKRFSKSASHWAGSSSLRQVIGELPRYLLEGLTIGVLLGIVLYLLITNDGNLVAIIPTLGVFAFAALRMLPAVQQAYYSISAVRSGQAVLDNICKEYFEASNNIVDRNELSADKIMKMDNKIELKDVKYSYPGSKLDLLKSINLVINAGESVGVVGGTGAGKTTLVDIILGLLNPAKGGFYVDNIIIDNNNVRSWQKAIGYVPQTIFLVDATILENIAFGVPENKINYEDVKRAAKLAALTDYVEQLPDGFYTEVGERGVRLSGGQRQRIGIARALYNNPTLLIMDEATSALDNITEKVVMEAVNNIKSNVTLILIAHRLSTVINCDKIILMEKGEIKDIGSYQDLVLRSEIFRKMAGI